MKDLVEKAGMKEVFIASAATSTEEIGNPVHYGTRNKLSQFGISVNGKYAVQMTREDYHIYDYIIAMDDMNVRNILRITGGDPDSKVRKLLSFAGSDADISDPWYTGNFDDTYNDVLIGCKSLIANILNSN